MRARRRRRRLRRSCQARDRVIALFSTPPQLRRTDRLCQSNSASGKVGPQIVPLRTTKNIVEGQKNADLSRGIVCPLKLNRVPRRTRHRQTSPLLLSSFSPYFRRRPSVLRRPAARCQRRRDWQSTQRGDGTGTTPRRSLQETSGVASLIDIFTFQI